MTVPYINTHYELVEILFLGFSKKFEDEILPYKNHVYRIINFYVAFKGELSKDEESKLIIAASFHTLGIYDKKSFNYIASSIQYARAYLRENNLEQWNDEIIEMIQTQQKSIRYKGKNKFNTFEKANYIERSKSKEKFDIEKKFFYEIDILFPDKGFSKILKINRFNSLLSLMLRLS